MIDDAPPPGIDRPSEIAWSCPLPAGTHDTIKGLFLPAFASETLAALEDAATCAVDTSAGGRLAFTTDAFVVRPPFFPGGDIGRLAVCGTVNDLAVAGAVPRYLCAAFILEEGLSMRDLGRVVASMQQACKEARVLLVAGDTKVVDRGKGDQIFITTSGIGIVPPGLHLSVHGARPGDAVLVSGTIGDHGIAILSVREGLELDTALESDCAPLGDLARALLTACPRTRAMRDPTRGGLAGTLHEIAEASRVGVRIKESALPIRPEVRAACELLGLDALHVASEGKLVAVVPAEDTERALATLRASPLGRDAALIGEVVTEDPGVVTMTSLVGSWRIVSPLLGEQLPRIC